MEVGAHSFVIRRPLPSPLRYGQWLWWDEWNEAKKNHHCHSWLILFVHHSWLGSVPPPLARRNLSSPASDTKNERHEWKTWKQRLGSEPRRERRPTGGSMEWRRWFVSLVPHHLREKRSVGRMGWGTQPLRWSLRCFYETVRPAGEPVRHGDRREPGRTGNGMNDMRFQLQNSFIIIRNLMS